MGTQAPDEAAGERSEWRRGIRWKARPDAKRAEGVKLETPPFDFHSKIAL